MKKMISAAFLALCLCMVFVFAAFAEDPEPVAADELAAWAEEIKAPALNASPENDPTAEEADVEGGILFQYPFATVYADRTEMTAETRLNAVSYTEAEDISFRNLTLSMTPADVIARFPNNNPDQAGTPNGAVLYLQESDDGGIRFGRVYRDGQRVSAIKYGHLVPAEDGYALATLTCSFTDSLLTEIRAEGFDLSASPRLSQEDRDDLALELNALASRNEYKAVKTSRNGLELTAFGPEDLVFSGIDFPSLRPEDLPGTPETETFDNGDGTSLLRVDGDGYIAVFRSAEDGAYSVISLSIEDDILEGPRGVRLGDAFHEDYQRFRSEMNGADENMFEVLYGAENEVPRGTAEYGGLDGITLRYVTAAADGREAELMLRYTLSVLSEIILVIR